MAAIAPRPRCSDESPGETERLLGQVPWSDLSHAYGSAFDVPALIYAVVVGGDQTRADAWWELWSNVHHQGSVYEATIPVVPFIGRVAQDTQHPDTVEAIFFLRAVALGDGSHAHAVRMAVQPFAVSLAASSGNDPGLIQRVILWLLSAFPDLPDRYPDCAA